MKASMKEEDETQSSYVTKKLAEEKYLKIQFISMFMLKIN